MEEGSRSMSRKEKRKSAKREKRKQIRKELAEKARAELEARLNDPEEQRRIRLQEEIENERLHRERKEFEERERIFLEELATKQEEEDERSKLNQAELENEANEDDDWEYVEEGPPEIIWQGNEIIVKKKRVRVKKKDADTEPKKEGIDRPTSNPLPPQSEVFADYKNAPVFSAQQLLENVAQQVPNFGTEQDKAHCPFHIKTGACRFGSRCSRVHFYPDKSCTLLFKNMYNGPGLAWEQDEGLEYMDEEVERCYEEFYEDVHTEFLKFGEIVNFKVCRNGSFHLRGNVYVHYKSLDSAVLAHHSINGRYFAGKQVSCEYVSVTKWKIAICGEYMKSRLKTCSRGTACNFIHCFRNPGGDYEWADWDKPPPKYWVRKMVALFGYSDESAHDKQMEQERDRYYSRRSRSKERDYLNGSSSRSRYEGHDVQKSTTQQRRARDGRKRLITVEDVTNSKTDPHGKNRTCDADSDGDLSDGGRNGNRCHDSTSKSSRLNTKVTKSRECHRGTKRTHQSGSDRDLSDTDRDRDRHRQQNKVFEISDDFEESKNNRARLVDAGGDWLDERERVRHYSDKRKSSSHQEKVSKSPKGYQDSTRSTRGSDSAEDWSDADREKHHHRMRASSRTSNEVSELSNDHGESEKISNNKVHSRVSDLSKSEVQRVRTRRNSSRSDRSSKETNEADFPDTSNSDRYGQRIKSHDLESRYDYDENIEKPDHRESDIEFLGKHTKSKRKLTPEDNVEHGGSGRYNRRSKSRSAYYPDENDDDGGRWEPEEIVQEKKHKSRRELGDDDSKQYKGKSESHDQTSDEFYGESRLRGGHGKHRDNLEKNDSGEEFQESEDKSSKRHRGKHSRSHGHKRHDK